MSDDQPTTPLGPLGPQNPQNPYFAHPAPQGPPPAGPPPQPYGATLVSRVIAHASITSGKVRFALS